MKMLNHVHMTKLIESIETETHLYIIMEFAEGGELYDYLVNRGKLTVHESMEKFRQLISGVEYLQQHNIW